MRFFDLGGASEMVIPKMELTRKDEDPVIEKTDDHKHEWKLITRTFGAPRRDINLGTGNVSDEVIQRVLFGFTSFLWECLVCKIIRKEDMIGSEGNRLEDELDKVETLGTPQYIQRNGITFMISIAQPAQPQSPGMLPIR